MFYTTKIYTEPLRTSTYAKATNSAVTLTIKFLKPNRKCTQRHSQYKTVCHFSLTLLHRVRGGRNDKQSYTL